MSKKTDNKATLLLKRILETVWLVVAIIALVIAIRETISVGINKSLLYYLFSGIAFFFYLSRRKQRIRN